MNTTSVDAYLEDGCGRCDLYQTPSCKVHQWTAPLVALRGILQASGLTEEMKWGSPCYTLGGKNVIMLTSFKDFCALSFLKGAALKDDAGVLERPGPNSRYIRYLKFRSMGDVETRREQAVELIAQAMELERQGIEVDPPKDDEPIPEEFQQRLDEDPRLAEAFEALTPGRQRGYLLHFRGAKKSATRAARVERCVPKILAGKGFHDY